MWALRFHIYIRHYLSHQTYLILESAKSWSDFFFSICLFQSGMYPILIGRPFMLQSFRTRGFQLRIVSCKLHTSHNLLMSECFMSYKSGTKSSMTFGIKYLHMGWDHITKYSCQSFWVDVSISEFKIHVILWINSRSCVMGNYIVWFMTSVHKQKQIPMQLSQRFVIV